jgi:hypothetical protein
VLDKKAPEFEKLSKKQKEAIYDMLKKVLILVSRHLSSERSHFQSQVFLSENYTEVLLNNNRHLRPLTIIVFP